MCFMLMYNGSGIEFGYIQDMNLYLCILSTFVNFICQNMKVILGCIHLLKKNINFIYYLVEDCVLDTLALG